MALDGIMFEGVTVRVRRPNDYNPTAAASLGPSQPSNNLNLAAIGLQQGKANLASAMGAAAGQGISSAAQRLASHRLTSC